MLGWILLGLATMAVGVIIINGIVDKNSISREMRSRNFKKAIIEEVNNCSNTVKLRDLYNDETIEIRGDSIDYSLKDATLFTHRGAKMNGNINLKFDDIFEAIAEVIKRKEYKEVYTFEECINFYKKCKDEYPCVTGFVLSVKENSEKESVNDELVIIQAMINSQRQPVKDNNGESLSKVEYAKTIDKKLVDLLNGKEVKMIQIK